MAHKFHGGSTGKGHEGHEHGPILTPMTEVFGSDDVKGDSGDCHDGVPGYPPGSGGKAPELTYVENGEWQKVKKSDYKEE